jgi:hypothetical protein
MKDQVIVASSDGEEPNIKAFVEHSTSVSIGPVDGSKEVCRYCLSIAILLILAFFFRFNFGETEAEGYKQRPPRKVEKSKPIKRQC